MSHNGSSLLSNNNLVRQQKTVGYTIYDQPLSRTTQTEWTGSAKAGLDAAKTTMDVRSRWIRNYKHTILNRPYH